MNAKGIGPQGLGVKTNNGYWIGSGSGGSPMKQTDPQKKYKEATSQFDNFNTKSDTLVKGTSRDMATSRRMAIFNGRNFLTPHKDEKVFKESDGSYSTMRVYKKDSPIEQTAKDSCYKKVRATYDVFPSAYASGAIAKCRKNKGKK